MDNAQQTGTTTGPPATEKTITLRDNTLRDKAENLKKDICDNLPQGKLLSVDRSSSKDATAAMRETIEQFRRAMQSKINGIQNEIISHVPKKPTQEEFQNLKKQYEQAIDEYAVDSLQATEVVQKVVCILAKTIRSLTEFSLVLWDLIKTNDPDAENQCKEFMSKLAKDIEGGFSSGPENSAGKTTV